VQFRHTPQYDASDCPVDHSSRGCRSHSSAIVSINASVYLPAPCGPARISECGNRPAAIAIRSPSIAGALP